MLSSVYTDVSTVEFVFIQDGTRFSDFLILQILLTHQWMFAAACLL